MRFEPKSDKELYGLLDDGEYDFEIIEAKDDVSKTSGNEMLVVTAKVFGPDKDHTIKDYITNNGKLKKLCDTLGMMDAYNAGDLPAIDLVGACGKCKVGIEKSEQYGDKNRIVSYVPAGKASTAPPVTTADKVPPPAKKPAKAQQTVPPAPPDDDIPF